MQKKIDFEKLVSRADIHLDGPVKRREGGMPLGNGIMGSLVWTGPQSLKFQINRTDVFANNCETNSFPERSMDYGYACGCIDVDFPDYHEDVFGEKELKQHLSIYDGILTMMGKDVVCQVTAWHKNDIMLIQVEDNRENKSGSVVRLRMMRPAFSRIRSHTAESSFTKDDDGIVLSQEYKEDAYVCSSALAVDVEGKPYRIMENSDGELALHLEPGKGTYTIVIGSAAAFAEKEEGLRKVAAEMGKAQAESFGAVVEDNKKWWSSYWKKGYVQLSSKDGKAEEVEKHYTYYLYLMASCSRRGTYAPNYGGLIWSTRGDLRAWGTQFWWNNMNNYYHGLLPANRPEIMDPYFNMYYSMHDSLTVAAQQQFGSKGLFIPETTWFDGLAKLPEDIAEEMRDLYLLNRPWATRSQRFRDFAHLKTPQNSRWNWKNYGRYINGKWVFEERGHGPFGRVLHLLESGGKLAYQYWLRYEYTQDKEWLREIGYPMIKDLAEFFRNYPNLKQDNEGIYHIYLVNDQETFWGGTDTMGMMLAMKLTFPAAIRASKVLEIDEDLRECWQEVSDNLAPLPISTSPNAHGHSEPGEKPFWTRGLRPSDSASGGVTAAPITTDLCTLETKEVDPEMFEVGLSTFRKQNPEMFTKDTAVIFASHTQGMAYLGLSDYMHHILYNQATQDFPSAIKEYPTEEPNIKVLFYASKNYGGIQAVMENRLTSVEGINAIEAQRFGAVTAALHASLCQDNPGAPGLDSVIRVFPAWPADWDADFQLAARGGFLISASMKSGVIEDVELLSQHGGTCRIRNPWKGKEVTVHKNDEALCKTGDDLISIETEKGDTIRLSMESVERR